MRCIRVAAAVVLHEGRVLLTQRPPGGANPMMWEFPGGKLEPGESVPQALAREIAEELGVTATPHEPVGSSTYTYPGGLRVEIEFVRCTLATHAFQPNDEVNDLRWLRPAEVDLREVLAADRDFLVSMGASPLADGPHGG